ncbi:type II and III secretion system protein family protein [Asticcacaulis sp.]|uniref:type II and III secretion system protein family protein n=1 Tax=Asticcacaulis sp. TaxID=1872648 RepID=UPI002B830374|nr:type II and III secretion system protein family protein [Asticcacaulis sp.]HTM80578.1 type II and III secretion system protein family protein [Asticcacaulis sp.]
MKPFKHHALMAGLSLTALAFTLFSAASVSAEPRSYTGNAGLQVQTQSAPVKTQVLNLPKGRSAVVDLPVDASDVFVSNPAVADAVLRTPRRIFVLGVANGQSDAIFFDGMGRQILNLSIIVDAPTDGLADAIGRLFPGTHVEVQSVNGHVVLSGIAHDVGESDQISRLAASFAGSPDNVLNLMTIAGKDQVTLKVRIVEVNRSSIKQLGLSSSITYNNGTKSYSFGRSNTYGANGGFQGGKGLCYGQAKTATLNGSTTTTTTSGGTTTTVSNSGKLNYGTSSDACLEAFEHAGLARTLAEPNLTAVSGESAKFLAGGEFPVPTGEDDQGRVSITFKPFGVGLGFTPVVLSGGRISLKISTEVSELTNTGAFTVSGGVTIPALSVRRAETSVEMQSGSSLMIAGLLQSKLKESLDSLPGMTSLPVLGSLFRSRDFLNDETEMVVLVTPYIVDPTNPDAMQTPADNLQAASDMSATFMGTLNRIVKPAGDSTQAAAAAPYQAPVGYVIE